MVASAKPDGHTLMLAEAGTYVVNPNLYPKERMPVDVMRDFIPITALVRIHHALIASPNFPADSVADVIKMAREKPGTVTYGTAGIGSGPHVNVARLENTAKIKMLPVHYRGATPAMNDVMGGHTNMMLIAVSSALPQRRAGKVKMLGIGSPKRLAKVPDVPTIAEGGNLPGFLAGTWFGLAVTGGTPRPIVDKISKDVRAVMGEPAFKERFLDRLMYEPWTVLARGVPAIHPRRDQELGQGDRGAESEAQELTKISRAIIRPADSSPPLRFQRRNGARSAPAQAPQRQIPATDTPAQASIPAATPSGTVARCTVNRQALNPTSPHIVLAISAAVAGPPTRNWKISIRLVITIGKTASRPVTVGPTRPLRPTTAATRQATIARAPACRTTRARSAASGRAGSARSAVCKQRRPRDWPRPRRNVHSTARNNRRRRTTTATAPAR
jgi:hypothetical protein